MDRRLGIGVIGLGWMGRVHTSAYRRLLEHFPELGVMPRLVAASDLSKARRAHAERLGFARTTDD
jgi:predicted dehydrogenase